MKILLDIDNVVADWSGHACRSMGHNPYEEPLRSRLQSQECVTGILNTDDLWKLIGEEGAKWWAEIPMFPWSRRLWHVCRKIAPTAFLTKPWPGHGVDILSAACAGKAEWITKHFKTQDFFLGINKEFIASPDLLLIDDSRENCDKFIKAGGYAFYWPNPSMTLQTRTWNNSILDLMGYIEFVMKPELDADRIENVKTMRAVLRKVVVI